MATTACPVVFSRCATARAVRRSDKTFAACERFWPTVVDQKRSIRTRAGATSARPLRCSTMIMATLERLALWLTNRIEVPKSSALSASARAALMPGPSGVDPIGSICMNQALCESDISSHHTLGQLRRCGRVVACFGKRSPMTVPASHPTVKGRSMFVPPSWAQIESYEKTSADGGVLLSLLRISLSNMLCVRRRPEPRRPLWDSDESCPPVAATPLTGSKPAPACRVNESRRR